MIALTAIKKLEKLGFNVFGSTEIFYIATKNGIEISFSSYLGKTKTNGFSYKDDSSCALTFGLNFKNATAGI